MVQDILPKTQYGMTVGRCKYSWESGGTLSPLGPGQHPSGGRAQGLKPPEALKILHFTVPKMGLKLMHFCPSIVAEIIRIGRQKYLRK